MESDDSYRRRVRITIPRNQVAAHAIAGVAVGLTLDTIGQMFGCDRLDQDVGENAADLALKKNDPFGDAVKAAQDLPDTAKHYTPERFSDNKDFDADKAWRETMGSNW